LKARLGLGILAAAALLSVVGLRGCRPEPGIARVVLVSIDTLRADHLGCYGYTRPTSPALDDLAAKGVLFEQASSPSPWTLPAHASLLTGVYPSRHGLKAHDRHLPSSVRTLAGAFMRGGFRTAAVVNSNNLGPRFGLDRRFQDYLYVEERPDQREPSTRITDQALDWIRQHRRRRLFLFVHYYDVHSDYRSRPEFEAEFVTPYRGSADGTTAQLMAFREGKLRLGPADAAHLVNLYDAGVRQMDAELARFLTALQDDGLLEGTLLVVTSDHGEEFLERGGVLHGRTQFQEMLHVPLVVVGPALAGGRRVATPVSLIDVPRTLLSLSGVEAPRMDGEDLTPLLHGRTPRHLVERDIFGEADHNNQEHDITRSLRRGASKLHFDRLTQATALYDLASDPKELTDLSLRDAGAVAELRKRLDRFLELRPEPAPPVRLSPEEIEKLRSLGYIR
jgi:arylsulfatase A-like enzyme